MSRRPSFSRSSLAASTMSVTVRAGERKMGHSKDFEVPRGISNLPYYSQPPGAGCGALDVDM